MLPSVRSCRGGEKNRIVIVILCDDTGYADLGVQGGTLTPTPNIDSIAAGGVRCTNGYVSCPYCSPTRAGLMTGRYQQRFGHEYNEGQGRLPFGLPLGETTFAQRMKDLGYATAAVGKMAPGPRSEVSTDAARVRRVLRHPWQRSLFSSQADRFAHRLRPQQGRGRRVLHYRRLRRAGRRIHPRACRAAVLPVLCRSTPCINRSRRRTNI